MAAPGTSSNRRVHDGRAAAGSDSSSTDRAVQAWLHGAPPCNTRRPTSKMGSPTSKMGGQPPKRRGGGSRNGRRAKGAPPTHLPGRTCNGGRGDDEHLPWAGDAACGWQGRAERAPRLAGGARSAVRCSGLLPRYLRTLRINPPHRPHRRAASRMPDCDIRSGQEPPLGGVKAALPAPPALLAPQLAR